MQSTDIVLVFTTAKGIEGINGGKVTLGGDASVAAGPVGRDGFGRHRPTFKAEVYSYSRSRGVFAGLALDGTVISIDDDANERLLQEARRRGGRHHQRQRKSQDTPRGASSPRSPRPPTRNVPLRRPARPLRPRHR